MRGSLLRVAAGALVSIVTVDAILIFTFLFAEQRWSEWGGVAANIVLFSIAMMLIPAVLISLAAEMLLKKGVPSRWFIALGGLTGAGVGLCFAVIASLDGIFIESYAVLGVVGGVGGASSMHFLRCRDAANNSLKSGTPKIGAP